MKNINLKKIGSKLLVFGLPLVLVGTLLVAHFVGTNNKDIEVENNIVSGETNKIKRKIYLKNKEGLLVPLTINVEHYENRVDEIKYLISLIKKDNNVTEGYKGLLNEDVELLNVTLEDSKLTLDFNEAFNNYDKNDEIRIIESLVWISAQYRDISQIKILVNGEELTKMPLGNCPIPRILDRKFGINNHIFTPKANKENIVVYFEDLTSENLVYVPVSVRVEEKSQKIQSVMASFAENVPTYTNLRKAKVLNKIEFSDIPNIIDNVVNVDLTASSLIDEKTVDRDVYEYLVMSFRDNMELIESVNVIVQDEIMSVNGYKESVISVSSVYENVIGI